MTYLLVPIHLDTLHLNDSIAAICPACDFTRQPYFHNGEKRAYNPGIAPVSEEMAAQPFEDRNFRLKPGIHLHWALPDALTKSISKNKLREDSETAFPPVPNRWMVRRRDGAGNNGTKCWIVESDYLYPPGTAHPGTSVTVPHPEDTNQPFRYMGRTIAIEDGYQTDVDASYWGKHLTAVGYGDPAFAALYPNCHSVFGFYDPDYPRDNQGRPKNGLQYDVIGWYDAGANDYLNTFITFVQENMENEDLRDVIKKEFKWSVSLADGQPFPQSMHVLCHACLTFDPKNGQSTPSSGHRIVIANTGAEALAADLAEKMAAELNVSDRKGVIEEQLEALLVAPQIEHRQLDVGPKLKEARHHKGFKAVPAGIIWTILSEKDGVQPADGSAAGEQTPLTDDIGRQLNEINSLQQEYDRAVQQIESMQDRLFTDWYKYALCAYPQEGRQDDYPNVDEVKHFIELKGLAPLTKKQAATGTFGFERDDTGRIVTAVPSPDTTSYSLAARLAEDVNRLLASLEEQACASLRISPADILNWQRFARRFVQRDPSPLSATLTGLWSLLPEDIPDIINELVDDENIPNDDDQNKIITAMNDLEFDLDAVFDEVKDVVDLSLAALQIWEIDSDKRSPKQVLKLKRAILEACFPENIRKSPALEYRLKQAAAPRYWEASEPVLLLNGDLIRPSHRHGADGRFDPEGLVACTIFAGGNDSLETLIDNKFQPVLDCLEALHSTTGEPQIAFSRWQQNPWHPLVLEWETKFYPSEKKNHHTDPEATGTKTGLYHPEFITHHYKLMENQIDLTQQLWANWNSDKKL